jgi:YggT family protein
MSLINLINALFFIFYVLLFANIIFSWVRPNPYHPGYGPIIRFVYAVTEPVLNPVRRLMPALGGLDFSPMIVLILARFLQRAIISLIV